MSLITREMVLEVLGFFVCCFFSILIFLGKKQLQILTFLEKTKV